MTERRRHRKNRPQPTGPEVSGFSPLTGILAGAGVVAVAAGYLLLSQGSISLAPVLLVIGYLVLFPLALIK